MINSADESAEDESVQERAERLREAISKSGGPTTVAKRAGLAATTIHNYLAGRDMKASALISLAAACDVSLLWLATGVGQREGNAMAGQSCVAGFGTSLYQPANFMQFCLLLATCQEWHRKNAAVPTLAEVFEWIGPIYPLSLSHPDRQIELRNLPA